MVIKDFILQGVRCFKEPIRFQFHNRLNAIVGGNEKGKTTIADALFFLFSIGKNKEENEKLRSTATRESRLGITFQDGPDNFRLLMDLTSNAVLLSRYNQETKKFDTISKDADEIKEFFEKELLFKPFDQYKNIYLINHYNLTPMFFNLPQTSDKPGEIASFAGNSADYNNVLSEDETPYFSQENQEEDDNMTEDEIRSEIEKLEKELKLSAEITNKQEKIEQLESELTNIQNKLQEINMRKTELQEIEKQVNELNKFSDLPEDIESKITDYIKFEEKIKKDIENIEKQKSQYESLNLEIPPFYKNRIFITGGGLAILFIILPIILDTFGMSWGIYTSAGVFIGFGLMGYILWKDANKRSELKGMREKVAALEKQIKEQKNKYEIEGSVIRSIITSMQIDSPEALREGIKRYKVVLEKFAQAKSLYNAVIAENDPDALKKQEDKLKSEINTIQEELRTSFSAGNDPFLITQRIEALKNKLKHNNPHPQQKPVTPKKDTKAISINDNQVQSLPFMKGINALIELTGEQKDRILSLIASRAGGHLKDLTKGKFIEIKLTDNKIVPITNSNKEIDFDSLSDSMKERCLFSIVLATLEYAADKWPWTVVLDAPFMCLDESNMNIVYNKIKILSKETQIILLTNDRNIKSIADNMIVLQ